MNAISVVATPLTDEQLPRHLFGDDVSEIRTDQQPEEQISREPREAESSQEFTGHERGDERESRARAPLPRFPHAPAGPTSRMMTMAATTRTIPASRFIDCREDADAA